MKTTKYFIIYTLLACVTFYSCQEIEEPEIDASTITTHDVENISSTTASLSGTFSKMEDKYYGDFVISASPKFINYRTVSAYKEGYTFYTDVDDLVPGVTYYCALSVRDGDFRTMGNVVKFTTESRDIPVGEAVDLGLSVKWANFNVGATSPEEAGGYYAWGETEEKGDYSIETYKFCNGTNNSYTKYCSNSSYGKVDNKKRLDLVDDVAHIKWGGSWRMPTEDEIEELYNKCTWKYTTLNQVKGMTVTGPNGNSIFLPAASYRKGLYINHDEYSSETSFYSYYLSSDLSDYNSAIFISGFELYHYATYGNWTIRQEKENYLYRELGHLVRPVCE